MFVNSLLHLPQLPRYSKQKSPLGHNSFKSGVRSSAFLKSRSNWWVKMVMQTRETPACKSSLFHLVHECVCNTLLWHGFWASLSRNYKESQVCSVNSKHTEGGEIHSESHSGKLPVTKSTSCQGYGDLQNTSLPVRGTDIHPQTHWRIERNCIWSRGTQDTLTDHCCALWKEWA